MKKFWLAAFCLLLCLSCGSALATEAAGAQPYGTAIYVNGQYLPLDTPPLLAEGTTFVPLRVVSSALGAKVSWQNGVAEITQGDKTVTMRPTAAAVEVSGRGAPRMAAPRLVDGRIMVPLRFVSEQLGAGVSYEDHVVDITTPADAVLPDIPTFYGDDDLWLREDAAYVYYTDAGQLIRLNKQTLAAEPLAISPDCTDDAMELYDGKLYYRERSEAGGKLIVYDLAAGREIAAISEDELGTRAYRYRIYNGWLYFQNAPRYNAQLYRLALADGLPQGQPQLVADAAFHYWFIGDTLYYDDWGIKVFRAGLDGSGREKLALDRFGGCHDAGWYYYSERTADAAELYRTRPGDAAPQKLLQLDNGGSYLDIRQVQAVGNKIYFKTVLEAEYLPGLTAQVSGPVWRVDLNGRNLTQVTDCKTLAFCVFRDIILYQGVPEGSDKPVMLAKRLND